MADVNQNFSGGPSENMQQDFSGGGSQTLRQTVRFGTTVPTPVDATLTRQGQAADAQATGNAIRAVEADVTTLSGTVTTLSGTVTSQGQTIEAMDDRVSAAEDSLTSLGSRMTTAEGDIDALQDSVEAAQEDIEGLDERVTSAETDITGLGTRLDTAEDDIDAAEERLDTAEADISGVKNRLDTAEDDIEGLDERMTSSEDDIEGLDTRIGTAEGDIDAVETRMGTAESDIDALEGDVDNLDENKLDNAAAAVKAAIIDIVYPVGSIYMSTSNVSPETFLGGTWEAIEGKFLLASDGSHTAGSTGGSETVQLTANQLPKISGNIGSGGGSTGETGTGHGGIRVSTTDGVFSVPSSAQLRYSFSQQGTDGFPSGMAGTLVHMEFGNNESHDNMPPYLSVYMWERTA